MTSSLVGSEMCIRDRTMTVSLTVSGETTLPGEEVGTADARAKLATDNPLSVSYTHLTLPTICSV
eukprot:713525-Prorocentrum_lima.AAC.1